MNLSYRRSYPKLTPDGKLKLDKKGKSITVYVYGVTGKPEDIAKYGAIMDAGAHNWKDPDGTVVHFTTRPAGINCQLMISINDKLYIDTSAIDMANALIEQYGEVGKIMAAEILKNGFTPPSAVAVEVPVDNDPL